MLDCTITLKTKPMTNKFKVGDSVRRKSPRAKAAKIVGEYGKGWFDISYPSTDKRYRIHQRFLELVVKPDPKYRSELYKLLPMVSEWGGFNWAAADNDKNIYLHELEPKLGPYGWVSGTHDYCENHNTIPPSINWKDTLVSREEMEAWEASIEQLATEVADQFLKVFTPTTDEPTETPRQKVERLKLELEEAEKELDRVTPIDLDVVDTQSVGGVFIGDGVNPEGLLGKCLLFASDDLRMEQNQHIQDNINYTVLTFFKL